jgi:tetratricopeptide (TPR) repeat protein
MTSPTTPQDESTVPAQASPGPPPPAARSAAGRWAVVVLLLVGVAAGVVAVWYWSTQVKVIDAKNAAGPAEWDFNKASAELDDLRQRYVDTHGQGDPRAMIKEFRRLVERYPRFAAARSQLGLVLYEAQRWEDAYEQLKISLELDAQQPEVHLLAGTVALNIGLIDDAERHYSQAVGLDPSNPVFLVHLAQVYVRKQEFDKAQRRLLEAIKLDSSSHSAYGTLADVYARQNKMDLALQFIDKAIENTPLEHRGVQVNYIQRKAAYLRRKNKPDEALLVLQGLFPQEQAEAAVIEDMALCWAQLGKPANGAKLYESELIARPTELDLLVGAARWRLKAGDKQTAARHLEAIKKINPRLQVVQQLEDALAAPAAPPSTPAPAPTPTP